MDIVERRTTEMQPADSDKLLPDLDTLYGAPINPTLNHQDEAKVRPASLHALEKTSSEWLRSMMRVTSAGLGITRYTYCDIPILWVINRDGVVIFALEEVIDSSTKMFIFPRAKSNTSTKLARLGHPSLLDGAAGRIGGEIWFDNSTRHWRLTNASGRYGTAFGRTPQHLENAKQLFATFGIEFVSQFIPARLT